MKILLLETIVVYGFNEN